MNPTSMLTQIMVHDWQTKGYAISEWNNDYSEFFRKIGLDPDQVNITTTTGTNIVYSKNLLKESLVRPFVNRLRGTIEFRNSYLR